MAEISGEMDDLLMDILLRLPVKKLCQLRSVSKQWNELISSSFFITAHHNNKKDDDDASYILFSLSITNVHVPSYGFYTLPQDSPLAQLPLFSPIPFRRGFYIVGVINGVVLMNYYCPTVKHAVAWNPTIRKHVDIPDSSSAYPGRDHWDYAGFGFDSDENDFKVIGCWKNKYKHMERPIFEVFSMRQGSWRNLELDDHIGQFNLSNDSHGSGLFLNGCNHWAIWRSEEGKSKILRELLVFDCEREKFRIMQFPLECQEKIVSCTVKLMTHQGKLVAFAVGTAFWRMELYGDSSSWKKLTISDYDDIVLITERRVAQISDIAHRNYGDFKIFEDVPIDSKNSYHPWNGYSFKPSMFLMNHRLSHTTEPYLDQPARVIKTNIEF